jgi:hypothetical protein
METSESSTLSVMRSAALICAVDAYSGIRAPISEQFAHGLPDRGIVGVLAGEAVDGHVECLDECAIIH